MIQKRNATTVSDVKETAAPAQETPVAEAAPAVEAPQVTDTEAEAISTVDSELVGSKSDKVAFVAALGDPSRDDVTPATDKTPKQVFPTIVGYAFKALEDMEIPDCGAGDDIKSNNMTYKDANGKRMVKAGEIFYLTRFETGAFLSAPEFNCIASGGDLPVMCYYIGENKRSSNGKAVSFGIKFPTVAVKPLDNKQSIKNYKMINVLKFEKKTQASGVSTVTREIIPGFEKWKGLCEVNRAGGAYRAASSASGKNTRNKNAVKFMQLLQKAQQKSNQ